MNHHHQRYHPQNSPQGTRMAASSLPSSSSAAAASATLERPSSPADVMSDCYIPLSTCTSTSSSREKRVHVFRPPHPHHHQQHHHHQQAQPNYYSLLDPTDTENGSNRSHRSLNSISIVPPPSCVTVDELSSSSHNRSVQRRGAAGYSELLKSAFEASMKFDIDFDDDDDNDNDGNGDDNYRLRRRRQEDDDYSSIRSDCTSQEDFVERKRRRSMSSIASNCSSTGFTAPTSTSAAAAASHTANSFSNKRRRTSSILGSMLQGMELQTNNSMPSSGKPSYHQS